MNRAFGVAGPGWEGLEFEGGISRQVYRTCCDSDHGHLFVMGGSYRGSRVGVGHSIEARPALQGHG